MSKQQQHWEKTRGLLFVTLAIWFVFSIGIFFFGAEMQESNIRPFGYPLTYWFTSWNFRNTNFLVCGKTRKD